MIYPPSQAPTPQARPPRVNREIVAVLMAMAGISAFLIHYTRDAWCEQPGLGRFCLPALFAPEAALEGDSEGAGTLSRPGSLEGRPLAQPPSADAPDPASPTAAAIDPWTAGTVPTPSLDGGSLVDLTGPGGAYPGPSQAGTSGASLAPTTSPFDPQPIIDPAATISAMSRQQATPDYGATSTAQASQAAQATSTPAAEGTDAGASTATATVTSAAPTAYP